MDNLIDAALNLTGPATEGLRLADRMPLGVSGPDKIARHRILRASKCRDGATGSTMCKRRSWER